MAMAFRCHHALSRNPLKNSRGFPTSAIFGSAMFLFKLIEEEKPDYLVLASDSAGKNFRHELFSEYKANRKEMPDELSIQIPELFSMFSDWGLPLIKLNGFEADDLIGSMAKQWVDSQLHCFIVSGDKDFMQLLNPNVFLYSPKKGGKVITTDEEKFTERFHGCTPRQMIDIMALWGDNSDNVPGVRGVGEKGAAKLVHEFRTLDGIYENLHLIPNERIRKNLENARTEAFLSQKLVTIKTDVELPLHLEDTKIDKDALLNNTKLLSFFDRMDFTLLSKRLQKYIHKTPDISRGKAEPVRKKAQPAEKTDKKELVLEDKLPKTTFADLETKKNYHLVKNLVELTEFKNELSRVSVFSFDTETTGLDIIKDSPIGISFSLPKGNSYFIPLLAKHLEGIDQQIICSHLRPFFSNQNVLKIAHNLKFDMQMLQNIGVEVASPFSDSMILAFMFDSSLRSYGIDSLVQNYLNFTKIPTSHLIGKKANKSMVDVPLVDLCEYACEDAECCLLLHQKIYDRLPDDVMQVYKNIELPLVPILAKMERAGFLISSDKLIKISEKLFGQAQIFEKEIYELAEEEFNINSPKQLQSILFDKLKIHEQLNIKKLKKTKSGFSTDVTVLESLAAHPLPEKILKYRSITKLKNTYVDTLPQLINDQSGRIHTSFHQTGTATGRLSSSHPNLQNIPIRSVQGKEIRTAFISSQEKCIISADYSQIELRLLAHMANDANLQDAFLDDADIHSATAATMLKKELKDISTADRSKAKAINYGIIYGMGAQRLAKSTGVSLKEAKSFIEAYFNSFPGIKKFIEDSISFATEYGYSRTITGRRRPIAGLDGRLGNLALANAKNIAVNSPIQGSAADLIKLAMIKIKECLETQGLEAKMLLQVHDELVFESPLEEKEQLISLIKSEMNNAMKLKIPLKTEIGFGTNWLEAH